MGALPNVADSTKTAETGIAEGIIGAFITVCSAMETIMFVQVFPGEY